jgi:hypothetical protein
MGPYDRLVSDSDKADGDDYCRGLQHLLHAEKAIGVTRMDEWSNAKWIVSMHNPCEHCQKLRHVKKKSASLWCTAMDANAAARCDVKESSERALNPIVTWDVLEIALIRSSSCQDQ